MPIELHKTMYEQQQDAHALLNVIQGLIENKQTNTSIQALDNKILEGLIQLYAIGTNIEDSKSGSAIDPNDITQIGEYGFNFLTELLQWAHTNHRRDFTKSTHQLILSLSLWITNHGGVPKDLVPCTDEQAYWHGCAACRWELKIHEQFNNDATHTLDERENRKSFSEFSARRKKGLYLVWFEVGRFAKITK